MDWEGAPTGNILIQEDTLKGLQWLDLSVTSGGSGLSILDVFDMSNATPREIAAMVGVFVQTTGYPPKNP